MGAVPSITIEEYLRGLIVNYPLPDAVINGILARRDIESGSPAFQRNAEGAEPLTWIQNAIWLRLMSTSRLELS